MRYNRNLNFVIILVVLGLILSFSYSYNNYVKSSYAESAENNREIVRQYNNEIIGRILLQEDIEAWSDIVGEYADLAVEIEDNNNMNVIQSVGENFKEPSIRVRTPFEFKNKVYLIESSMFVFKDYDEGINGALYNFVIIEASLGIAFLCMLVFALYNFKLKHYKKLYKAIEDYEKTGKLKKAELKGYAGHIYKRFRSMTENLEIQRKNQQNIIASISHDIKTPLTSIMGYAERLGKDNISEERRARYLDTIYGKSLEIQKLVNEFDEYLSFDVPLQSETEEITTEYLTEKLREDYESDLELLGVKLIVNNRAPGAKMSVDKSKMKRVFGNIFGNSVKHFNSQEKIIDVDISCDKQKIYIVISDNGEGVEEEKLEVIFEPLYTSDEGRKVAGLGLAICREIIESHGGDIYARKSESCGLAICIELYKINGKNARSSTKGYL